MIPLMTGEGKRGLEWLIGCSPLQLWQPEKGTPAPVHRVGRHDDGVLGSLFGEDAFDKIIDSVPLTPHMVQIAKDGHRRSGKEFTRERGSQGPPEPYVDPRKILQLMLAGNSVTLRDIHRYWSPVREVTQQLSVELGCAVTAHAYVSPPGVTALRPHFDYSDIIVLQIQGDKEWLTFEQNADLPLAETPWRPFRNSVNLRLLDREATPAEALTLSRGDVLFLPRGTSHSVSSRSTLSIHITFVIHTWTYADIAQSMLSQVGTFSGIREALPMPHGAAADLGDEIGTTVELLAQTAAAAGIGNIEWAMASRALFDIAEGALYPLAQMKWLANPDPKTTLKRRPHVVVKMLDLGEELEVRGIGVTVRVPRVALDVVSLALSGKTFTVEGLAADLDLDAKQVSRLVEGLVQAGVVVVISGGEDAS